MNTLTELPPKSSKSFAARLGWAALVLATFYACYFSQLGALGFVGPDEPRYAWIAREMADSGDWVTPRLYGRPWFEKPPLYYWGAALSFKVLGVNEAAARLPSALSALLATLALAWFAWRVYGPGIARWLLLLVPATVGMTGFSHAAATDMPFAGMLTIAMVCAAIILRITPEHPGIWANGTPVRRSLAPTQDRPAPFSTSAAGLVHKAWVAAVLYGFFLGLAVLAKGPAGMVLCGGSVFFWAVFTRRWRDAFRLLHPIAVAAFCLTALPWYVLCARRNPNFIRVFIIEHNFQRYLTPEFQHIQPFWFYLPITLAALLPWTLFLVPAVRNIKQSLRDRVQSRPVTIFLWSSALFPCIFFSFSKSKLPGYILPAVPPLVLVCCVACTKLISEKSRYSRAVLSGTCLIAIAMIGAGVVYTLRLLHLSDLRMVADYFPFGLRVFALLVLLILIFPAWLFARYRAGSLIGIVVALVILLSFTPLSRLDSALSPRQTAQGIARIAKPGEQILLCDMPRTYFHGFSFYLRREVSEWNDRNPQEPALVVIGSPACWSELAATEYYLRSELDFARWPVVELEGGSAADPALGGNRNKK